MLKPNIPNLYFVWYFCQWKENLKFDRFQNDEVYIVPVLR